MPANYFAARALKDIALFATLLNDKALTKRARTLRQQILTGLECYARVEDPTYGSILAYETDGMGRHVLMDDANVPSLLSLPYLGAIDMDDPLYQNTRRFVLSRKNPFYAEGQFARGIGSPHTPKGYIWHIALCIQMMTTHDIDEQATLLKMLITTHADTGFMHEGFDPDKPEHFTRSWFAWANSLFGECIWRLHDEGTLQRVLAKL